ncbi:DUF3833 domain-containing protein [Nitrospirillum sp. BR 11752]|uniref:DUF3833 domain-containing protein n=1 Tax=Nitrospirillum sp. BR 11752 TaxID=3104293 RepID=UPI002ECED0B2|nr:DUF3833 domain-containing protein [Nitrospirillum sp. BR 11752]
MWRRICAALLCAPLLSSCAGMAPKDFAGGTPPLVLEDYFTGHTKAWGLFEDRFGKVRRQFTVDIEGTRQDGALILHERFLYNDGEREERTWTVRRVAPDRYEGTAGDVVGVARGVASGNAFNWAYRLDLKVGDGTMRVAFDDWMFLQPGGVMLNRAHVTKWGVEIGSVSIFFQKAPPDEGASTAPSQQ